MTENQKNNLSNNINLLIDKMAIIKMQRELVRRAKLSPRTITSWKSGKQRPTIRTAQRICDIIGVNINDMINKKLEMEFIFNIKFKDLEEDINESI